MALHKIHLVFDRPFMQGTVPVPRCGASPWLDKTRIFEEVTCKRCLKYVSNFQRRLNAGYGMVEDTSDS